MANDAAPEIGDGVVVRWNQYKNPKTALAYGVRSAPTMLLFKGGAVQATQMGLVSKAQLTKVIDAAL